MSLFILIFFLLSNASTLWGEKISPYGQCSLFSKSLLEETNEKIRKFISEISQEQKEILEDFFRLVVKDHYTGYVLFGDKPICIETYPLEIVDIDLPGINQTSAYVKWMNLWRELEIFPDNKDYFFIDFDAYGYHHIVCINRNAFLQTVNHQLHLFQYVLGSTLTAENLLKELIQAKEDFYNVLKYDNVLLGILLGYGTENALLISREEFITDAFAKDHKEEFPFIAKKLRFRQTRLPKMQSKRPSLGYSTLADEVEGIRKITTTSSDLKSFNFCRIPHFGCNPDSQETQKLVARYAANRLTILQSLESDKFLEKILTKLFTTTSQLIEIPKVTSIGLDSSLKNKEELDASIADFLFNEIQSKNFFDESYVKACLEGMKAYQNGKYTSQFFEVENHFAMVSEMDEIAKDLSRIKNLEKSDGYFNDLDLQKELIALVPEKVYYKVLKEGIGTPLSLKAKDVSFHYTCFILNEKDLYDAGTLKKESLEYFIPGVSIALIGMKKGEEREIYIHPEYGYGENTYLEPNITIIARIELLDFSEAKEKTTFSPSHQLERNNSAELFEKYRRLCCKECYDEGALFINSIEKSKLTDSKTIQKCFNCFQSSIKSDSD